MNIFHNIQQITYHISRCFDLIRKNVSSSSGFNIPTMYEALQDKSDKAAACVLDCSSSNVD